MLQAPPFSTTSFDSTSARDAGRSSAAQRAGRHRHPGSSMASPWQTEICTSSAGKALQVAPARPRADRPGRRQPIFAPETRARARDHDRKGSCPPALERGALDAANCAARDELAGHASARELPASSCPHGGGSAGTLGDLYRFDPAAARWTVLEADRPATPGPLSAFGFSSSGDGRLALFGGMGPDGGERLRCAPPKTAPNTPTVRSVKRPKCAVFVPYVLIPTR